MAPSGDSAAMASQGEPSSAEASLLRAGEEQEEDESEELCSGGQSGQSLTAGRTKLGPLALVALVALGAVVVCALVRPARSGARRSTRLALRSLQDDDGGQQDGDEDQYADQYADQYDDQDDDSSQDDYSYDDQDDAQGDSQAGDDDQNAGQYDDQYDDQDDDSQGADDSQDYSSEDDQDGQSDLGSSQLQGVGLCNQDADGGASSSYPFQLPGEWQQRCSGEGGNPVQAPPTETKFNDQRNWCWHWIKHKGCKEVIASLNWKDAQEKTASMGLCPSYAEAPMDSVLNPELCSATELGQLDAPDADADAALEWLKSNIAVFVLNLDKDAERLAAVTGNLDGLGIEFERIPGIDMNVDGAFEKAVADGVIPSTFSVETAQQVAGEGVSGTVGTAAAHLNAHQHAIDNSNGKPLALILEDDVRLEPDFAVKLQKLLSEEAPCDWQAISLKAGCPHGQCVGPHLTRVHPDANEPAERCRHGSNYGFYGMLYQVNSLPTLTASLSQRVWDANTPHCLDVDVALASIADQLYYYAVPFWQKPGFLQMGGYGSTRADTNR